MHRSAEISGDYRYWLRRQWCDRAPGICWVMLNPSRADDTVDDPTIRRCIGFSQRWGYGHLVVVNLFAYRTPHPKDLLQVPDPIGPENDRHLLVCARQANRVLLAWGQRGNVYDRDRVVGQQLQALATCYCLGQTRSGQPRHPLYLRRETQPQVFPAALQAAISDGPQPPRTAVRSD